MKSIDKKQQKIKAVMREYYSGSLKSSSGKNVSSPKQALAIAYSYFKRK